MTQPPRNPHLHPDHLPDLGRFAEQLGDDWVRLAGPLPPEQRTALGVLLYAPTVAEAARYLGMPPSRLYYWIKKKDDFRDALESLQRSNLEQGGRYLESCWLIAIETLCELAANSSEDSQRQSAAKALADITLKWQRLQMDRQKLEALDRRVDQLEVDWQTLQNASPEEAERLFQAIQKGER